MFSIILYSSYLMLLTCETLRTLIRSKTIKIWIFSHVLLKFVPHVSLLLKSESDRVYREYLKSAPRMAPEPYMLCSLASHDSKFAEFDEEIRIMERLDLCRPTRSYTFTCISWNCCALEKNWQQIWNQQQKLQDTRTVFSAFISADWKRLYFCWLPKSLILTGG